LLLKIICHLSESGAVVLAPRTQRITNRFFPQEIYWVLTLVTDRRTREGFERSRKAHWKNGIRSREAIASWREARAASWARKYGSLAREVLIVIFSGQTWHLKSSIIDTQNAQNPVSDLFMRQIRTDKIHHSASNRIAQ
jgi:hypothetical protein